MDKKSDSSFRNSKSEFLELQRRINDIESELADLRARYDELRCLAYEDPLTRILNRRGLQQEVERAIALKRQHETAIAFLLFDLDDLKGINDKYGHAAGDAVLTVMAETLTSNARSSDAVARLGGDEFAVLLWNTDLKIAEERGREITRTLEATRISLNGGHFTAYTSFGASAIGADDDFVTICETADRSLYEQKSQKNLGKDKGTETERLSSVSNDTGGS